MNDGKRCVQCPIPFCDDCPDTEVLPEEHLTAACPAALVKQLKWQGVLAAGNVDPRYLLVVPPNHPLAGLPGVVINRPLPTDLNDEHPHW